MITIYTIPLSLYCAKLRILLRYKNLNWQELPPPGGYGSDEYKTIVPSGNLPALVDGDFQLADSEAIAEYLNEKYSQPNMLPEDINQRAKIRELSRFHDTRLEPELRKLFPYLSNKKTDMEIIHNQSELISMRLKQLSELIEDETRSIDNQLTLGDCGFPITFSWIDAITPLLGLTIEWPQRIIAYKNELVHHETVAQELKEYQPVLNNWLTSQS